MRIITKVSTEANRDSYQNSIYIYNSLYIKCNFSFHKYFQSFSRSFLGTCANTKIKSLLNDSYVHQPKTTIYSNKDLNTQNEVEAIAFKYFVSATYFRLYMLQIMKMPPTKVVKYKYVIKDGKYTLYVCRQEEDAVIS